MLLGVAENRKTITTHNNGGGHAANENFPKDSFALHDRTHHLTQGHPLGCSYITSAEKVKRVETDFLHERRPSK